MKQAFKRFLVFWRGVIKWKIKDGAWDDILLDIYIKDITEADVTRETYLCVDIY